MNYWPIPSKSIYNMTLNLTLALKLRITIKLFDGSVLLNDDGFIDCLVDKVSKAVIANPKFQDLISLTVRDQNTTLLEQTKKLEEAEEIQEQYSTHNCLVIHGIQKKEKKKNRENTDEEIKNLF